MRVEALCELYEHLRSQAVSPRESWGTAAGHGILLRLGLCAWMHRAAEPPSPPPLAPRPPSAHIEPLHAHLGAVIADMILQPLGSP